MNDLEKSLAFVATEQELANVRSLPLSALPLISVVIPSFNQAAFISETLDSVFAQQFPKMEVYVADGGSSDGTVSILERYASIYPGVFRYDSRPDGGHYQGVNKGIANTTGDIIAWINSDDVYLPETFWKIVTFFYYNRGSLIVYGGNRYVDRELKTISDYPADWSPLLSEQRRRMMHFCTIPQPSLFFRRVTVTLCGALASPILDYELWLRWQRDLPFFYYEDCLSLSRVHADAISMRAEKSLLTNICKTVHDYYDAVPLSWAFRAAFSEEYGAAWARGENPAPSTKVKVAVVWKWLSLNLRLAPRAAGRWWRSMRAFRKEISRLSA